MDTKEHKMGFTFVSLVPFVLIQPRYSGFDNELEQTALTPPPLVIDQPLLSIEPPAIPRERP
jgi:hypothetical protein